MKEKLMVRGQRHWVADKDGKVLLSHYDTYEEARNALLEMEKHDREEGVYVARFYTVVKGMLGTLRMNGYTAMEDIHICADL